MEQRYVTVAALTKYVKRKFDADPHLRDLWIKGEISNLSRHSRGHIYFTLKDDQGKVKAVMFSTYNRFLDFQLANGQAVFVRAEVSVYEPTGEYQLYVKEMKRDGVGSLFEAYERLKQQLTAEGLFEQRWKKALPSYAASVALITSPTGAAVRDMVTTLRRRSPQVKVIVVPALVQGEKAPQSLVAAIERVERLSVDVCLIGRGGGSIEELWAFNDERVVRAMFAAQTPIISAVGHETDVTLADFVADLRAPTPTAAAELAVPDWRDVADMIDQQRMRMKRAMEHRLQLQRNELARLEQSYAFRYPRRLVEQKEQQLDMMLRRLAEAMRRKVTKEKQRVWQWDSRLQRQAPHEKVKLSRQQIHHITNRLVAAMKRQLERQTARFASEAQMLDALSPLKIMGRGYSLTYQAGTLVKTTKQITVGETITVKVADGQFDATITSKGEK